MQLTKLRNGDHTNPVEAWGFARGPAGRLVIGGAFADALARKYGTPAQILDVEGLQRRARDFRRAFETAYPGDVRVHFAMKCNNTPGILRLLLEEGIEVEAGTPYEWLLARRLGIEPDRIVVNGPAKRELLEMAVCEGAGLTVIDGLAELSRAERLARQIGRPCPVLLRVNPDFVPAGMNRASATGSRKNSVFGLDTISGELHEAYRRIATSRELEFRGLHFHIGTGIQRTRDYREPVRKLVQWASEARDFGLEPAVLDVGGGFGVSTSRELDTMEFLAYQAIGRLPHAPESHRFSPIEEFANTVCQTLEEECRLRRLPLPKLLLEPGRALVSAAGVLLLGVQAIKERDGVGSWAITDGGAGTVAFPLYYEYHEIFLCRSVQASKDRKYTIVGPACFSADWVCRSKKMPPLEVGDVLAVCDTGAYFTVQETNFGFPRPPIVAVRSGKSWLLRRRERFDDMVARDLNWEGNDENRQPRSA